MTTDATPTLRSRLGAAFRPALAYELWATLIFAFLLVPASGWLLDWLVVRGGSYAISDHDLVAFAVSVPGLLFLLLSVGFALLFWHLEQAGLLLVVVRVSRGGRVPVSRILWENGKSLPALLRLGLLQGGVLLLAFVPVGLVTMLIKRLLLSEFDFYYYFTVQPPVWWVSVTIAGAFVGAYLVLALWLYVRWIYAIPALLFERLGVLAAIRASWRRTRSRVRSIVLPLILCWAVVLPVLWGASWLVRTLAARWLGGVDTLALLVPAVLAALATLAAVELLILVVGKIVHGALVADAYLGDPETPPLADTESAQDTPLALAWIRLAWVGAGVAVLALAIGSTAPLLAGLGGERAIDITGHRGNKNRAPENTLAAIELAIEEGADFAEIDVQTTADGMVVLLHDDDLWRVARDRRRLRDVAYRDLQDLDAGSWFDPAFHAERIPTLQQVIDAVRGRAKLNIELKYTWPDPDLAAKVVQIVRENDVASQCVVTSLRRQALAEVEALHPELETGLIVLVAVGDLSRMEAGFLSIDAAQATPRLVRRLHQRGRGVHVWTVSDVPGALAMIEMSVDNIITDEPRVVRETIDQWNALSRGERLALRLRTLILDAEPPATEAP